MSDIWDIVAYRKGVAMQVLCDEDIARKYSGYKWHIDKNNTVRSKLGETPASGWVSLHRLIMSPEARQGVDHINGNRLDNRRANLRLCTQLQNIHNNGIRKDNKSGYKGVSWDKLNKKWVARLGIGNKYLNLGRFKRDYEAAIAYNQAAKEHFGEFARLNEVNL